jgi:hypothetical protein
MWSSRSVFEADVCPVGDDLLGELYRASEQGLPELVSSVPPEVRAMLALFCYRRNHMHALSLAIAGTCEEHHLVQLGGRVGAALFAQSRQKGGAPSTTSTRRPITLSTAPLATFAALEDDADGETPDTPATA